MTTPNTIRKSVLHLVHYSEASHVGSCLSICDILYTLYFKVLNVDPARPEMAERDKFLLSKGHASAALYSVLALKGFFPEEHLERFSVNDGLLPGHLDSSVVPGVEISAGSLGHGLSIGIGMAVANRLSKNPGRLFVLMGDGECNEGSVWEAAMMGSSLALANLTAIVDFNGLQGFYKTGEFADKEAMAARWRAFGWEVIEVNGHDLAQLEEVLKKPQTGPRAVIAHTVKGKGVSFMENKLEWHYRSPSDEQYEEAIKELSRES